MASPPRPSPLGRDGSVKARARLAIPFVTLTLAVAALVAPLPWRSEAGELRHVQITASQFAFTPSAVRVGRGDVVTLDIEALDSIHGLSLDGYDVNLKAEPGHRTSVTFHADREGKFVFRCSIACGALHPFMVGELEVTPNLPLARAVVALLIVLFGSLVLYPLAPAGAANQRSAQAPRRFELTRWPPLRRVLGSRWLQWALISATLPFFVLAVLAGFAGTPVGSRNFAIVFVWIVWWALLMLLLVPLGGRLWCAMCPLPAPGEWLQRRSLIRPRAGGRLSTLGRRWPARLRNMWTQNGGFLAVALFSIVIITGPLLTAGLLVGLAAVAIVTSLIFEGRVFCRYLCPVGGFVGLYAQVAPLAVRVRDRAVCLAHAEKPCLKGSDRGFGCPWLVVPGALARNAHCGLCTECLKTCDRGNVGLFLQAPAADLHADRQPRLDEAFKALIMLSCALLYSVVLLGPWAELKDVARGIGTWPWLGYALVFLTTNLVVVPGLFYACALWARRLGGRALDGGRVYSVLAQALIPLGLAAWAAFSLSFALANGSYAWPVLSDPLGWGWDLFGTAGLAWQPYASGALPLPRTLVLLAGLAGALAILGRMARELRLPGRALAPAVVFCSAFTLAFIIVYLG